MSAIIFTALPLIPIDVSVKSQGIIRPAHERTAIKSAIPGIIDSIFFQDGNLVEQGSIILKFKDEVSQVRSLRNHLEMDQYKQFMHDLSLLTSHKVIDRSLIRQLISPVYKSQSFRFVNHGAEQEASIRKVNKEERMNSYLFKEKVISSKEYFDIQIQREKTNAAHNAFINQQQNEWQQDLIKYQMMLAECEARENQLQIDAEHYQIRSPLTGTIQGIHGLYPGNWLATNEAFCFVSPEDDLVAECYISPREMGLIKINQQAYFQIDAFNYNYFGSLTGRITFIDNDYTMIEGKPFFKIQCGFNAKKLQTTKGVVAEIKKGLSFQARFVIAQRTIWQLLYDNVDSWLNPS